MWDAVPVALVLSLGSALATPAAAARLYSPEETRALLENILPPTTTAGRFSSAWRY